MKELLVRLQPERERERAQHPVRQPEQRRAHGHEGLAHARHQGLVRERPLGASAHHVKGLAVLVRRLGKDDDKSRGQWAGLMASPDEG